MPTRRFVIATLAAGLFTASTAAAAPDECHPRTQRDKRHPDCGVHNMMVVGQQAIYLSHLPMFDSEHRFQVILEATLARAGQDVGKLYADDRRANPGVRMYTFKPRDVFVMARLFPTDPAARKSFRGTLFRGHLERDGVQLDRLTGVDVVVKRVIYAQELGGTAGPAKPDTLEYILFGTPAELFLAHKIAGAPDFDQIVGVKVSGRAFSGEDLARGVTVKVADRPNTADRRLRPKDKSAVQAQVAGAAAALPLTVEVTTEFYFEDGELAADPTFDPTELEKAAGF